MSLHLAVNIVIVNLFQVIGEPFVFDCQQSEERGLACTLTANQTKHHLKLAAQLEYSTDCAQHEQLQAFIGQLTFLCSKKMGQGMLLGWAAFHQEELRENWELAKEQQELFAIEPLK